MVDLYFQVCIVKGFVYHIEYAAPPTHTGVDIRPPHTPHIPRHHTKHSLHHASAHPSPHPLLYLLSHESTPLLINATNSYQRTPLHCSVAYNSVYNTDLLLRRGADVQLCDNEGKTPIDYAHELENGEDMLAILEGDIKLHN